MVGSDRLTLAFDEGSQVGRIVVSIDIQNTAHPDCARKIDALVDTGASHITLPSAWRDRFGSFEDEQVVDFEMASQEIATGIVCGPARIQVEGFRVIHSELLFVEMTPEDGEYEPLLGYIALEQCGAAVDLIGHRLLPVRHMDLKSIARIPSYRRPLR